MDFVLEGGGSLFTGDDGREMHSGVREDSQSGSGLWRQWKRGFAVPT